MARPPADLAPLNAETQALAAQFLPLARAMAGLAYRKDWSADYDLLLSAAQWGLVTAAATWPGGRVPFAVYARARIRNCLWVESRKALRNGITWAPLDRSLAFAEPDRIDLVADRRAGFPGWSEEVLSLLPPVEAHTLRSLVLEGRSHREEASRCGTPPATVYSRYRAALGRLKPLLSEDHSC